MRNSLEGNSEKPRQGGFRKALLAFGLASAVGAGAFDTPKKAEDTPRKPNIAVEPAKLPGSSLDTVDPIRAAQLRAVSEELSGMSDDAREYRKLVTINPNNPAVSKSEVNRFLKDLAARHGVTNMTAAEANHLRALSTSWSLADITSNGKPLDENGDPPVEEATHDILMLETPEDVDKHLNRIRQIKEQALQRNKIVVDQIHDLGMEETGNEFESVVSDPHASQLQALGQENGSLESFIRDIEACEQALIASATAMESGEPVGGMGQTRAVLIEQLTSIYARTSLIPDDAPRKPNTPNEPQR